MALNIDMCKSISLLAFLLTMVPGCSLKLARKSLSEIAVGDDKQIVAEKWGRPDRVLSSIGRWGERELWTYNCAQFSECDSNCVYVTHVIMPTLRTVKL